MPTRSHPESARIIREARQAAGFSDEEIAFLASDGISV